MRRRYISLNFRYALSFLLVAIAALQQSFHVLIHRKGGLLAPPLHVEFDSVTSIGAAKKHAPPSGERNAPFLPNATDAAPSAPRGPEASASAAAARMRDHLWTESSVLPQWIKDYFDWHAEMRRRERLDGGSDTAKYLVVMCLKEMNQCGGLADRLKPLPYFVQFANMTRRVLLVHWTKPFPLEEFFVPPEGGIDWRLPPFLEAKESRDCSFVSTKTGEQCARKSSARVITGRLQAWDGGALYFNEHADDGFKFEDVLGTIFRCMFTLSKPLAARVNSSMTQLGLTPGQYTTAHVRARYPTPATKQKLNLAKKVDKDGGFIFKGAIRNRFIEVGVNAINCAWKLSPGDPIYFTSDSHHLTQYMLTESPFVTDEELSKLVTILAFERSEEPLHLEKKNVTGMEPRDFYPAFEDLWIVANGRCTSVGMGGFGRFGQLLSFNSSCANNHRNYRNRIISCPAPGQKSIQMERASAHLRKE